MALNNLADKPKRPWPRYSLMNSLLLTAIFAMGITVTLLWREIAPLRAEVRALRSQVGELNIVDTETPCAIAIETDEPDTWKWRVYLPPLPQSEYVINCVSGLQDPVNSENVDSLLEQYRRAGRNWSVPRTGETPLSGEVFIEAKIIDREGYQFLQVRPYGGSVIGLPKVWRKYEDKTKSLIGLSTDQQIKFKRGEPVLLLCLQSEPFDVSQSGVKTLLPSVKSQTLMLWIHSIP